VFKSLPTSKHDVLTGEQIYLDDFPLPNIFFTGAQVYLNHFPLPKFIFVQVHRYILITFHFQR
jgi:hypothetical protein